MPDSNTEIGAVQELALITGMGITNILDARAVFGRDELGIDVVADFKGGRVGIQHTLLHPDEGLVAGKRGSLLRAQEESARRQARWPQPIWGVADCRPALGIRFAEKIEIAARHDNSGIVDEMWLVVSASRLYLSTITVAGLLTIDELNRLFHQSLAASRFEQVFFVLHADSVVYGWNRKYQWRLVADPHGPERERHRAGMCDLIFNKFHRR